MDNVDDLVLTPFREIVEKSTIAAGNAEDASPMHTSALRLQREAKRALKHIEPLCRRRFGDFGADFVSALKENYVIRQYYMELTDLLWEFDDFLEIDDFNAEKFEELHKLSRVAAPRVVEAIKCMKLEPTPPQPSSKDESSSTADVQASTLPNVSLFDHEKRQISPIRSSDTIEQADVDSQPLMEFHGRDIDPWKTYQRMSVDGASVAELALSKRIPATRSSQYATASSASPAASRLSGTRTPATSYSEAVYTDSSAKQSLQPTSALPQLELGFAQPTFSAVGSAPGKTGPEFSYIAAYMGNAKCVIQSDSSFHLAKGFCQGAKNVVQGQIGVKKSKRYGFSSPITVAQCTDCLFELRFDDVQRDVSRNENATYSSSEIRYRVRFLQKSHLAARRPDSMQFGCIFCVHQGYTTDESDATVFFTARALLSHIARHPRPLPQVTGFRVLDQVEVPHTARGDFDLHLVSPPQANAIQEHIGEVSQLPSGVSRETSRRMYGQRLLPDKTPAHELAAGAKLMGITWPPKYQGEWMMAWHDGVYASIPTNLVRLRPPPPSDIRMGRGMMRQGKARWKFSPLYKEQSDDFLRFDRDELISDMSCPYPEHWCWSGVNAKGRWGIFPRVFLDADTVSETSIRPFSALSNKGFRAGPWARMPSIKTDTIFSKLSDSSSSYKSRRSYDSRSTAPDEEFLPKLRARLGLPRGKIGSTAAPKEDDLEIEWLPSVDREQRIFEEAVSNPPQDLVDPPMERAGFDFVGHDGSTALHEANFIDSNTTAQTLVEGADVKSFGKTLHSIVLTGSIETARELIQELIQDGADVNAVDHQQKSALAMALEKTRPKVATLLVGAGAQTNIPWNHDLDSLTYSMAERGWLESSPEMDYSSLMKVLTMLAPYVFEYDALSTPQPWRLYVLCEWEIPQVLFDMTKSDTASAFTEAEPVYDMLASTVVLTGSDGRFLCSSCEGFLEQKWGEVGLTALRFVSQQLELMMGRAGAGEAVRNGKRTALPAKATRMTENYAAFVMEDHDYDHTSFTEAIQWLCSAVRPLPKSSAGSEEPLDGLWVSTPLRSQKSSLPRSLLEFSLAKLKPLPDEDIGPKKCWVPLFRRGVVAWWPVNREWGDGLELPFDMLVNLSAVENRVRMPYNTNGYEVDEIDDKLSSGACILMGYFTVLIPTDQNTEHNSIQWHLQFSENIVNPRDVLPCQRWLDMKHYLPFETARCFLGWSDPVNILLGTRAMDYNLRWSGSEEHRTVRRAGGTTFSGQLGFGNALSLSPKVTVKREYRMHSVVQNFTQQSQYDKAIVHLSRQVGFVFDASAQRAWLVPLLSLMLHLCHAYFSHFNTDLEVDDPIPFAIPQPDGAAAAMAALKGRRDDRVLGGLSLGSILLDIHTNMRESLQTRENPTGTTIFACEAMDQLNEPMNGSPLKARKLGFQSRAWLRLVPLADFICICSNLGEAMQPQCCDPSETCQCHVLPQNKSLLAVHNSCLELLMMRRGVTLETLQDDIWEINSKEFLSLRDWPFANCPHDPLNPFWSNCIKLLETSHRGLARMRPKQKRLALAKPPRPTGAVVFGKWS